MTARPFWAVSGQRERCARSLSSRAADRSSRSTVGVVEACGSYDVADGPSAVEGGGGAGAAKTRHLRALSRVSFQP